jgi:hypothetical protein
LLVFFVFFQVLFLKLPRQYVVNLFKGVFLSSITGYGR